MYGGGYPQGYYAGPHHAAWGVHQAYGGYMTTPPQQHGQYSLTSTYHQNNNRPPIDPSTGHDYRRADDGSTIVDLARVHFLLARRLACKMSRNYDEADKIRSELRDLGVEVQDKLKIWTARPVGHNYQAQTNYHPYGHAYEQQQQQQMYVQSQMQPRRHRRGQIDPTTGHDYARAENDRHAVDVLAVNQLIAKRLQCKMAGQYDEADRVREQLRIDHGVEVQDRDKLWRVVRVPLTSSGTEKIDTQSTAIAAALATANQLSQQLAKRPRESGGEEQQGAEDDQKSQEPKRQAQDRSPDEERDSDIVALDTPPTSSPQHDTDIIKEESPPTKSNTDQSFSSPLPPKAKAEDTSNSLDDDNNISSNLS
mmetsp:Transcript_12279/g.16570  ORF Transcript_12279/g.16570 Transcript_12279/m.16570 type:complete len:366 (+) Transcript_12279:77-1174(+)|eukprot:CAMPEP_0197287172 /NCGR_PEP_ID=MMETSP0890-20130614/3306_1 /TAXON_ID=44058 ORGANISM="Aureoumbra lagunensis, Strain CCMP1510" /NCGR_SAMPLE_ID=MMETSP0890 /ASSEMBLY_ACC=CAM_ASM_000533 /LENGTH=365 /DNA_ID=CAMNT_0042756527 /DNA_START=14 /DNA_END=1111 /DNA_ORIENTATION=+